MRSRSGLAKACLSGQELVPGPASPWQVAASRPTRPVSMMDRPMIIRWIPDVPSKIVKILALRSTQGTSKVHPHTINAPTSSLEVFAP
jgi:hypothetical protein